jgi:ubiquinone/menaquinone biosynthesis C-methylase UbiE
MVSNNKVYWKKVPLLDSFFKKKLLENREKILKIFHNKINYNNEMSFLDVGTTGNTEKNHNLILQKISNNKNITCLSNQDCSFLKNQYPNIKNFIIGDGCNNQLKDNTFDIVYSNATIEHVGSHNNQKLFISECVRVAKKNIFITTPNRYFPLDFHTKIPLIHFLPKIIHRKILNLFGHSFFAKEENLNLLSKKDLIDHCEKLKIKNYKIISYKIYHFTSNLILIIEK